MNSSVAENWEDFITCELVAHIDSTYRALPHAAARGITGHSMGAMGALHMAMEHPGIFGSVYSGSPGGLHVDPTGLGAGPHEPSRSSRAPLRGSPGSCHTSCGLIHGKPSRSPDTPDYFAIGRFSITHVASAFAWLSLFGQPTGQYHQSLHNASP